MRLDRSTRRRLALADALFVALVGLVFALAAWLTHNHRYQADWTAAGRNTLAEASRSVIEGLERPARITAYLGRAPAKRQGIRDLVERYRRAGADVRLDFVNPETNPGIARELGIRSGGELIVRYGEREERLQRISEQSLTNALARLSRERDHWVIFLQGHGERSPDGEANFDLERFVGRLRDSGLRVQSHNLARTPYLPDNADLVVLASPQQSYLPGERASVRRYVRDGGNLLWLREPGADTQLGALAADLGVRRHPGVVVDPAARLVGSESPDFAVVSDYGDHAVTRALEALTLFPRAVALETVDEAPGWRYTPLLESRSKAWAETGPLEGEIRPEPASGDTPGPLLLGVAAQRGGHDGAPSQRVAVLGDGDFLSNAYLGNGANLELGLRLVEWLAVGESRITIETGGQGLALSMSQRGLAVLGLALLAGVPALLLGIAGWLALRRRRG